MARISTHVLDIERGKPAEGVGLDLYFRGQLIRSASTNVNGRTDVPLVDTEKLEAGEYELIFHTGNYLPQRSFYGDISVRFRVTDPAENYHIPLLLASHGYSTYRGS